MEYIAYKRFKGKGIDGSFNLPFGTVVYADGRFLRTKDGRLICAVTSENAWEHFRENTPEGEWRQKMLTKLYSFYESGKGSTESLSSFVKDGMQNRYWKNILRTMPTNVLFEHYSNVIGK
jgi:hypothetical protein